MGRDLSSVNSAKPPYPAKVSFFQQCLEHPIAVVPAVVWMRR